MKSKLLAAAAVGALMLAAGQATAAEDAAAAAAEVDELVVFGHGETRQVSTLQIKDIEQAAPGTSPIKMVSKLPGVNFQSADAFGAYEWSARISIRGFNQNYLGFTLDDVPLGDMSYGNYNGLHISRAIASEDIGSVVLAQGSGALGTASSSNLGGTLKFISRDPADKFGAFVAGTAGSDSMYRGFVRVESGEIAGGGKGYISYAKQQADKWKGVGEQNQEQINAKFVQPLGEAKLTGFYNWSKRRENDYQDLSLAMIHRAGEGYNWDNISGNWALANQIADIANNRGDTGAPVTNAAAGTVYPSPIQTADDAYFDAAGLRDDKLYGATLEAPIGEIFKAKATVYKHQNQGQGIWFTPYTPTPGGGPISIRTTEYDIDRQGAVVDGTLTLGAHVIEGGFWIEDNDFNQARRFYGTQRAAPGRSSLDFQSNPFFTQWEYAFNTKTREYNLADTWAITDSLKLNAGFKGLEVRNTSNTVTGPVINGKIESKDDFLPQVGVNYSLNENNEFFASYAENMKAFVSAATSGPFSTTAAGFAAIKDKLKPETSKTVEIGWRFRTADFQGVVAAYHVNFENRLLATTVGAGIVGNPAALANVGGVKTQGVEAAGTWTITHDWSLFGSYAYTDAKYEDNVFDGTGALQARTSGKTVVDTPKHLAHGEVAYDNGAFYAKLGANYTSERFYTYLNDAKVPSYVLADFSAGYRLSGSDLLEGLEVQFNVTNLFDKKYVATIGSNGFANSDPAGTFQTLLAGAPRQVFVSVRKTF
jgi:iron complex outermembrane receptor protein